jgi:hypothetical protein
MYEIMKIQMHFQSNCLLFWFKYFFYKCVDFGESVKDEILLVMSQ